MSRGKNIKANDKRWTTRVGGKLYAVWTEQGLGDCMRADLRKVRSAVSGGSSEGESLERTSAYVGNVQTESMTSR